MTAVSSTNAVSSTATPVGTKSSLGQLGSADFLKLMTTQLKQQDPFNPTDNTQMLAQMAQFSSLSQANDTNKGVAEMNQRLAEISSKLDAVVAAQVAVTKAQASATSASTSAPAISAAA